MSNLHIEHIEDLIFTGHFLQAFDTLDAINDVLRGEHIDSISVTTKYDGAPAVVFGYHPETGDQFIGTKSVFNKRSPIICYSEDDIRHLYADKADLMNKLLTVWDALPYMAYGVWQADLMWHEPLVAKNGSYTFTPNTITYSIPASDCVSNGMANASVGLVIHTKYVGDTLNDMKAIPTDKQDLSNSDWYYGHNSAYVFDHTKPLSLSPFAQLDLLDDHMAALEEVSVRNIARVAWHEVKHHAEYLKMFVNYCVRMGESTPSSSMYAKFLENRSETVMALEVENTNAFNVLFALHERISYAKQIIMDTLNIDQPFITYIGDQPVLGEGFVVVYHGVPVKLVNRLEFSRLNFMNKKFEKVK